MDMVLQGDKNGVFSDVCGYDGKRECLIVGGGNVAYRKVIVMLDFGAKVTVVAENICDELRKLTIDDIASEDKTGSYTANKRKQSDGPGCSR